MPYDGGTLEQKVARRRRLLRSRLVSLGITIVVLVVIYLWQRDQLQGAGFIALYAIVLLASVGWLAVSVILYLLARRELGSVGTGTAVRIGPPGVQVAGLTATWAEVASLGSVRGGLGRGPLLQLGLTDGRQASVPFDQLPVFPATLDSTARAFSGGRFGVDLSALDS